MKADDTGPGDFQIRFGAAVKSRGLAKIPHLGKGFACFESQAPNLPTARALSLTRVSLFNFAP
jgi:hypothetical protein